jgi:Cu(I)/Ag(I) efflux system membrane fusion protein
MKSNIKLIVTAVIAILTGLALGYLIFGKNEVKSTTPSDTNAGNEKAVQTSSEEQIFTCAMHPQIRQNEFGICPICEMDLTPLESNTSDDPLVLQMTESAAKLANIQTTTIGKKEGKTGKSIRLSGKVKADERLASSQVAHIPGRIEKLYVSFTGEPVKKGQKLADIYSPDLITAQRELLEALKLKDINPNLVEASRNKLRFWKIGKEVIDAIEKNGAAQEIFTIFADDTGIVTDRKIAVGDYVKQGEPLFELMNLSKVWVLFDAYEEDLKNFKIGSQIEFTTPALPNKIFKTRVTFIDPVINPNTRVASVRTEVSNTKGLLKPEMFVYGKLEEKRTLTTQLTIPKSAVLWTGKRSVVYVKVPDMEIPSFKYKEIEIGESLGDSYQVISGLEPGEEVVTNGSFTIDAAAQLNNQMSMMNKNVNMKKEEVGVPNFEAETPIELKKQIDALVNQYIPLKNAFVDTDAQAAAAATQAFLDQMSKVNTELLEGEASAYLMRQFNNLRSHGEKITETKEVEEQRRQFSFLSQSLIDLIEAFGTTNEILHVQHCPMALDNEGADWLALEEQIRNPYFGDKMMKCGLVKKSFSKNND